MERAQLARPQPSLARYLQCVAVPASVSIHSFIELVTLTTRTPVEVPTTEGGIVVVSE